MGSAEPTNNITTLKPWERPSLVYIGNVSQVLQGGGGKLTPSPNDPGDINKPKGNGA